MDINDDKNVYLTDAVEKTKVEKDTLEQEQECFGVHRAGRLYYVT